MPVVSSLASQISPLNSEVLPSQTPLTRWISEARITLFVAHVLESQSRKRTAYHHFTTSTTAIRATYIATTNTIISRASHDYKQRHRIRHYPKQNHNHVLPTQSLAPRCDHPPIHFKPHIYHNNAQAHRAHDDSRPCRRRSRSQRNLKRQQIDQVRCWK